MTGEGRKKQIQIALKARDEKNQTDQHSHPLPWRGSTEYFPVVDLPLEVPLLNADSHRIRSELEAREYDFVRKERDTDKAQQVLTELWKTAHRKYDDLKDDLRLQGQTEPGAITRSGILINGNTRLIALRELQDSDRQVIQVAVLPSDARPRELAQLELRLQVRKPLLDEYKLSNELLFIKEMSHEYGMSNEQIATELHWNPSRPAIGGKKVEQYRRMLDVIRTMQSRDSQLPITFFDDKLEQLRELERNYNDLVQNGRIAQANLLLDEWLVIARGGFSSVHNIRPVYQCDDFIGDYLLPRLVDQDLLGDRAESLVRGKLSVETGLEGLEDLAIDPDGDTEACDYDLKPLLRLVEKLTNIESKTDTAITIPKGDGTKLDGIRIKHELQGAIRGAIKDFEAEGKAEHQLNAPEAALAKAVREIRKATEAFRDLKGTKEFEQQALGKFLYQVKQLRKRMKALEELLTEAPKAKARDE